ncbi:hypothetical protein [Limosilactobacillus fermentum]|uniref:hypothetical protein n=1 Tax=Limosilactobacillus fermentum TaxID=1613 RepID=UPI00128E2266|nr:hypothetical protein [Limosilactobacillus fermentum]MPW02856.1 hypothetical protein [Limosilactobacillus fermentum]
MRDAPIIPDGGRVAISGKCPAVGSPRCLQVAVSTTKHCTGLVLSSGAVVLSRLITSLLLATPSIWL